MQHSKGTFLIVIAVVALLISAWMARYNVHVTISSPADVDLKSILIHDRWNNIFITCYFYERQDWVTCREREFISD